MEDLFKTQLTTSEGSISYEVKFENEQYIFNPIAGNGSVFSIKREQDEWHGSDDIDPELRQQAIDTLENFLLKQH